MRSVLLLTLLAVSTAVSTLAQQPEGRGSVYAAVGYVDGTGVYGDDFAFTLSNVSTEIGAETHLLRRTVLTGTLGATFRMVAAEAAVGEDDANPLTSGFRPQHLNLYARIAGTYATATAGFILDLGPDIFEAEPDPDEPFHFLNSDMQHAIHLGLSGEAPAGSVRLHGRVDGFLTLPHSYTSTFLDTSPGSSGETFTIEGDIDFGDQIVLRAGGAYAFGATEIGLDLAYAVTTEGEEVRRSSTFVDFPGGANGEIRDPIASSFLLSLIPYITLTPAGSPFILTLAAEAPGGAYREHIPYGITLTGDNQSKARIPLSLRVRYGF